MNSISIFSTENDTHYLNHVKEVIKQSDSFRVFYSIGKQSNCKTEDICSTDAKTNPIFVQSYSFVPLYKKISGTCFWANSAYNVTVFGNKLLAIQSKLDIDKTNHILKHFIIPTMDLDLKYIKQYDEIKNFASSSNRLSIFLK